MKRRLLALLLAVLTLTMLTAAAFAEDTEVLGVYNVTGPLTADERHEGRRLLRRRGHVQAELHRPDRRIFARAAS